MRDVVSLFASLLCRAAGVSFVGAQVLSAFGTLADDPIEHHHQLADVMSMGSGKDDRQRVSTDINKQMMLAAVFPDPSGGYQRRRGQGLH